MYSLLIERLERHVLNERQVAIVAKLGGAKNVKLPTFETERHKVDRLLEVAPRREYSEEQAALIAALGLGGG